MSAVSPSISISALLKAGASASATDDNKLTPLHLAAAEGHAEAVKLLLGVGASLDAKVVVAPPTDAEARKAFDESLAGLADTSQVIAPHGKDVADAVDDLRFLFLVSDVEVVDTSDAVCGVCADQHVVSSADSFTGATVGVVEASTARCARCWYHDSTVGSLANHPALCARCGDAVGDDV